MADNHINYKISSMFEGEGFKKATQALNDNKKELNSVKSGLGEVSSAFKGLSPQAEQATNVVGTFVKAFTTGGIVGGAISLALDGIAFAIGKVGEKMKEAKEATEAWAGILKDNLVSAISSAKTEAGGLTNELKDIKTDIEDAIKAMNGETMANARIKAVEIHQEALDAVRNDMTESGTAFAKAVETYQLTILNANTETEKMNNTINKLSEYIAALTVKQQEINEKLNAAKQKETELIEQSSEYLSKKKDLEDRLFNAEQNFKDGIIDLKTVIGNRKEISLQLANLDKEYASTVAALKTAHDNVAEIEGNLKTVDKELATAVQKRTNAENELEVRTVELNQKSKEAKEAVDKLKEAQNEAANEFDNFISGELRRLNESTDRLSNANDFLADIENILAGKMQDIADGGTASAKPTPNKGPTEVKVKNPHEFPGFGGMEVKSNKEMADIPKPKKLDDATWERWKNGTANAADIERVKRFAEMDKRYKYDEYNRIAADMTKWVSQLDKPESWLSTRDKQLAETLKNDILPKIPEDIALKLLGDAANHVLVREDLKELFNDSQQMAQYLSALTDKVNLTGIENNIAEGNDLVARALTVR